jgi:hypothetical protein
LAENKTKRNDDSVIDFLNSIDHDSRREDAEVVGAMMERVTGESPKMWGTSIVGYGDVHLTYESGREVDVPKVAFSPRKAALVLYIESVFAGRAELLAKLGDHTTGKVCLYIKDLAKVEQAVLEDLIRASVEATEEFASE